MALFPLLVNPRFYFVDDYQLYFIPLFSEIARLLKSGTFPLLTDHSWFGGAILGNYECAVFNPVSLALYLAIDAVFSDLRLAATFFSLAHLAILSFGCFLLCTDLGCDRREAAVGALTAATGTWTLYWSATGWVSALVNLSWLPFALLYLMRASADRRSIVPAALFCALALVSGWPIGNLALFLVAGALALAAAWFRRDLPSGARVGLAIGLGTALALPAILPTWFLVDEGARFFAARADDQWQAPLKGLLTFGFPAFLTVWKGWDFQYRFVASPPMFYAGWFLPLVLASARWRAALAAGDWRGRLLVALTLGFLLLAMSPTIGQIRWSFRWIPELHLFLVLLAFWAIARERTVRADRGAAPWRPLAIGLGVALFGFVLAAQSAPSFLGVDAAFFAAIAVLTLLALAARSAGRRLAVFAAGHVAILGAMIVLWPMNGAVRDWGMPAARSFYAAEAGTPPRRQLTLFSPGVGPESRDPAWWAAIRPGNVGLLGGVPTLNGYSSIYPAGLTRGLCFDYKSAACPDASRRLFIRDVTTGVRLIDLLGVDRVVVARRTPHEAAFEAARTADWKLVATGTYARIYERSPRRLEAASGISWAAPGVSLTPLRRGTAQAEYKVASAADFGGGRVVFARAWYPGYEVRLNGAALPVEAHLGMLPSVLLPPGASGRLEIEYWPAGLTAGLWAAAAALCALLIVGILALRPPVRLRRPQMAEEMPR